jgi:large conductance mechanosensitive channel
MATAFAAVVLATVDLLMGLVGKIGGQPDFRGWEPGGLPFGAWVTAVISFLVLAAIVYFLVVKPYTAARERFFPSPEPGTPEDVELLRQIRDLLASQTGGTHSAGTTTPTP